MDPKKRIEVEMIQKKWIQISHRPIVSEVKTAALLAWEGYLASVEFMNIGNINITEIPRDQMDHLTSIVTKRVLIDDITHTNQLSSILASVRCSRLQMVNVALREADTQTLVTTMRDWVQAVWLDNVTFDIEELSWYDGQGACKEITVCGDRSKQELYCRLKSWAHQKQWALTVDNDEMLMMERM